MATDHNRPLRICFVSADYPTLTRGRSGGIGAHSYTLAHAVADLGHHVSVLAEATNGAGLQLDGNVEVHAISRGPQRQWKLGHWLPVPWLRWSFAVQRALRRLHSEHPYDIVEFPDGYAEGFRFSLSPYLPFVVRMGGPASIVQRWDGRTVPATRARIETWLERTPVARAPLLKCASRAFADQISREWSLDRSRFRIIRNPLNLERFRPTGSDFARSSLRVLFVGNFQPLKGVHDLVAAIPLVSARHPSVNFQMVGNDTRTGPGRTSLRQALEEKLREDGTLERVRFLDSLPQSELLPLYRDCSVFVMPSHNEVYGNVLLEAMGCGRPCVVTDTAGAAELVAESGCGIVVPPNQPLALANAISEILAMPEDLREEMGARGRRIVERLCGPSVIATQVLDVYREAIDRFNAGLHLAPAPNAISHGLSPSRTDLRSTVERPLRICFVSSDYPTLTRAGGGGIGFHSYTLAHAIANLGHDVSVLAEATTDPGLQNDGGVLVHAISAGSRWQWKLGRWVPVWWLRWSFAVHRALRRLHSEHPYDLVVFMEAYGQGFRFSLSPRLPFVVRLGGPASVVQRWDGRRIPATRARIETWLERTPAARAPLLLCASNTFVDRISQEWSLDRSQFRIIRNPLDLDRFHPAAPDYSRPGQRVLFVGHFQPLKGLQDLICAIPLVAERHPNVDFQLVGNDTKTGPARTSFRQALEHNLREHGALGRVRFMDPVPQPELVPLYQDCSIFVLPSHNDVYPNVVLEAMGCGRPCVVTHTAGAAELVAESECGIVVPPHQPLALADAISAILAMPENLREEMGARGRRIVERLCAMPVIASQEIEAYREAIDRFKSGSHRQRVNRQ